MRFDTGHSITGAIGQATCDIAHDLNCAAILTASATGRTARVVSRYRPRAPIICATNRQETYNRLALVWGVHPMLVEIADDFGQHDAGQSGRRGTVRPGQRR